MLHATLLTTPRPHITSGHVYRWIACAIVLATVLTPTPSKAIVPVIYATCVGDGNSSTYSCVCDDASCNGVWMSSTGPNSFNITTTNPSQVTTLAKAQCYQNPSLVVHCLKPVTPRFTID